MAKALALAEVRWQDLLRQAKTAWRDERPHDALQLCDRAALLSPPARHGAAILRGDILLQMGDAAGALSSFDSVADPSVEDAALDGARGLALFELGRFAEAQKALFSALRGNCIAADAHFALGIISEIRGTSEHVQHFRCARRLAPERFGYQPTLCRAHFQQLVESALQGLAPHIAGAVAKMTIMVCDMPRLADLQCSNPPMSPQSFGYYFALASGARQLAKNAPASPAILLFKRNLERACYDDKALIAAIGETIGEHVSDALNLC